MREYIIVNKVDVDVYRVYEFVVHQHKLCEKVMMRYCHYYSRFLHLSKSTVSQYI